LLLSLGMTRDVSTYAIYPSMSALHTAAEKLKAAGFRHTDISVLYSDGAVASAATGATMVVVLGYLAGIGALTIPGVGPLLAAGPILAALAGMGARANGGLIGALAGLGIPADEAHRYDGRLREGGILLSAHCDDTEWASRATEILNETGAEHVAFCSRRKEADYQP
jgi:hypothetical protein